jgi:hypothetical protein
MARLAHLKILRKDLCRQKLLLFGNLSTGPRLTNRCKVKPLDSKRVSVVL